MTDRHPYRWVIFSAMAAVYYSFGATVSSIPPMVSTVRDDLGISRGQMGLALGAWALIYIASAPPAGRIIDRIGLKWSLALGAASIALSGFARAGAQGLGTFWVAVAIFGIGGPLVSASAPKLAMVWFDDPKERRLAVGVYTASPALGGVTSLLLTNSVLLPLVDSWRWVVAIYAGLAVLTGLVWLAVAAAAPDPPPASVGAAAAQPGEWRRILSSRGVQLALALGIGSFFVNHALSAWLPDMLETDSGISATAASTWTGVSLLVGVGASLVVPRLATTARRGGMLIAAVCLGLGASLLLMAGGPLAVDVVAVLVAGIRAALIPLVIVLLMEADGVTADNVGLANGLWFSAVQIGGSSGPPVAGAISDATDGFTAVMVAFAAILAVLAVVSVVGQRWVAAR